MSIIPDITIKMLTATYSADERIMTAPITERRGGVVLKNIRSKTREKMIYALEVESCSQLDC